MKEREFAVDASLLEELGQRLIGRAPIALAELVKNAYDADATTCRIQFSDDQIVVADDGTGMSENDFLQYWMRIGTTHKIDRPTSPRGRPLTGSKGIGRLSVQFLAGKMVLESTTADDLDGTLYTKIDWSKVIRGADLATVKVRWDSVSETPEYPNGSKTGTRITLTNLKSRWDAEALETLGREVWRLRSPFRRPSATSKDRAPEEFDVEIEAPDIAQARESFDKARDIFFGNWRARIRGTLDHGRSGGKATIVIDFKSGYPKGADKGRFRETIDLPIRSPAPDEKPLLDRVRFEILVFKTTGKQPGGIPVADLRGYLEDYGNVSLYDAGFRLPYYGSGRDAAGQDWLSIAIDQGRRISESKLLPKRLQMQNRYMLDLPSPGRIFGVVDINTNSERFAAKRADAGGSPDTWLQLQPGRDRLQDNRAFRQLHDFVRYSLDLYANRYRLRFLQAGERQRDSEPASRKFDRVIRLLDENPKGLPVAARRQIELELRDARKAALGEEKQIDQRAALLAPLATAGMMAIALGHELGREIQFLRLTGSSLRQLVDSHDLPELMDIADRFDESQQRLSSLRELFAPHLSDVDAQAAERLRVRVVVSQTVEAMRVLMPKVEFDLSGIPRELLFPLGSLVEWNAILQNILANAWNAMLDSKQARVAFTGGQSGHTEWLHISDTGQGLGVPPADAEKLFEPFKRGFQIKPQQRSLAIGGQGLGLAIVRMIAARRGAKVEFANPEQGFSTTFAISWKGAAQ